MSPVQNRDRLHVQPATPHGEDVSDAFETPAQEQAEDYRAVRVHVTNPVATSTADVQFGIYETIVLAGGGNQQILPRDPLRQYAYIFAVDEPVVLTTTLEASQAPSNQVALVPNPSGAYLPAATWTPPIRHNDPVYAANTSATPTRVVFMVERGAQE
jgi:hypothetical protein